MNILSCHYILEYVDQDIMQDSIKIYGLIYAAMALLPILIRVIRRLVWISRQRVGPLLIRHLVLPLVFPRMRFLGNITWLHFCLQLTYVATNVVSSIVGVKSLHDAGVKTATLSTINFSLLLASQPALIADLMGLSLRTYLRIHGLVSLVTSAQVLAHLIILIVGKKVSIHSGTQLYGLLVSFMIMHTYCLLIISRLPLQLG